MNQEPIITVLMAVYNGEKYLKQAVDSILSQTFKDFEFVIVNDCSSDSTVDIIKSYNDKRILIYNNETNLGQTKSLNIGLKHAKGRYIFRMDADDYSMPERIEKQYNYINEYPEYTVVGTDCLVVDESNIAKSISRGCSKYEDIIIRMLNGSPINHVSVVMKKEAILAVGGYNSEYKISADFDLWSRLVRKGYKITTLPEILSAYRFSDSSYSNRNESIKLKENVEIVYENIKYFSNYSVEKESVKQLLHMSYSGFVNMSEESILESERIFKNIIIHLKPELNVRINKYKINKTFSMNYWIAAYHYLLDRKYKEARHIVSMCIRNHGFSLYSIAIYLLSYINIATLSKINYFRSKYLHLD